MKRLALTMVVMTTFGLLASVAHAAEAPQDAMLPSGPGLVLPVDPHVAGTLRKLSPPAEKQPSVPPFRPLFAGDASPSPARPETVCSIVVITVDPSIDPEFLLKASTTGVVPMKRVEPACQPTARR